MRNCTKVIILTAAALGIVGAYWIIKNIDEIEYDLWDIDDIPEEKEEISDEKSEESCAKEIDCTEKQE